MTFDQLRIFVAVADRLHVTRAAEALNLTQSAVSVSIANLESQSGVKLFHRVGRRIELSEAGKIFLEEARQILARVESARVVLQDLSAEPRGRLRLHSSQTVASYWLPARLIALQRAYPDIDVQVSVGNTAQVAEAVTEGSADIGLVESDINDTGLTRREVGSDHLAIGVRRDHPWAGRDRVPPKDYHTARWILRERGSGTRAEFERHLARQGMALEALTVSLELPSNEAILGAIAAGGDATVVSDLALAHAGALAVIRLADGRRPFSALTHPDRHQTRAMEALFDVLKTAPDA
ncbi:MAG: LysR substrate-binding domain-containing protein [Pseudomonadota bacterium]|nr:LysR substrate-binding domain-containing protein [Pseudomonadota bacterium]